MPLRILTPWVDGGWLPCCRRPAEPVTALFNGRTLAYLVAGDDADLDRAVAGAGGRETLAALPRHRRAEILEAASFLLREERAALARLIARDAGKPLALALAEVDRAVLVFRQASEEARRFGVSAIPADADPVAPA